MKRISFLFLLMASNAWACPACISAGNQKYILQTVAAVAVMCAIPLAVAGLVGWTIGRIQKNDAAQHPGD